jgi:hypothetical protein
MVDAINTTEANVANTNAKTDASSPRILRDVTAASTAKTTQSKSPKGHVGVRRVPIGDGETATSKIEIVDENTVKATYTFKLDQKSTLRYGVTTVFDYSGTSKAELMETSTRTHVITLQRKLREMGEGALDASVFSRVHVKSEIVEATRTAIDGPTRDLYAFARASKITDIDVARRWLAAIADGTAKLPK